MGGTSSALPHLFLLDGVCSAVGLHLSHHAVWTLKQTEERPARRGPQSQPCLSSPVGAPSWKWVLQMESTCPS